MTMVACDAEFRRPVVGYEGTYDISVKLGIRRISTGRILKQWLDSHGCPRVNLYLRGKRETFLVAHLVADAFLPPKSPTDQVLRHLNDNPSDNRPENLAWGTYSDNMADSIRNGKCIRAKGSAHCCAKLTEDRVREIRRSCAAGDCSQREMARQCGVHQSVISRIVLRQKWKHVV
jgi:hypothetical protein